MSASATLARLEVEFASKGMTELVADCERIRGKLEGSATSANKATTAFGRLSTMMSNFARVVNAPMAALSTGLLKAGEQIKAFGAKLNGLSALSRRFLIGGIAGIGLALRAALKDTVEGDELGKAFSELAKSIGNVFLPIVRQVTDALNKLSGWFNGLSESTKGWVRWIAIGAIGLAAFGSIIGPVVAGIGSLVAMAGAAAAAIAAIGVPAALVVAAIGGLAAAYLLWGNVSGDVETMVTKGLERILDVLSVVKAGFLAGVSIFAALKDVAVSFSVALVQNLVKLPSLVAQFIGKLPTIIMDVFTTLSTNISIFGQWLMKEFPSFFQRAFASVLQMFATFGGSAGNFMQSLRSVLTGGDWTFNLLNEVGKNLAAVKLPALNLPEFKFPEKAMAEMNDLLKQFTMPDLSAINRAGGEVAAIISNAMNEILNGNAGFAKQLVQQAKGLLGGNGPMSGTDRVSRSGSLLTRDGRGFS